MMGASDVVYVEKRRGSKNRSLGNPSDQFKCFGLTCYSSGFFLLCIIKTYLLLQWIVSPVYYKDLPVTPVGFFLLCIIDLPVTPVEFFSCVLYTYLLLQWVFSPVYYKYLPITPVIFFSCVL